MPDHYDAIVVGAVAPAHRRRCCWPDRVTVLVVDRRTSQRHGVDPSGSRSWHRRVDPLGTPGRRRRHRARRSGLRAGLGPITIAAHPGPMTASPSAMRRAEPSSTDPRDAAASAARGARGLRGRRPHRGRRRGRHRGHEKAAGSCSSGPRWSSARRTHSTWPSLRPERYYRAVAAMELRHVWTTCQSTDADRDPTGPGWRRMPTNDGLTLLVIAGRQRGERVQDRRGGQLLKTSISCPEIAERVRSATRQAPFARAGRRRTTSASRRPGSVLVGDAGYSRTPSRRRESATASAMRSGSRPQCRRVRARPTF